MGLNELEYNILSRAKLKGPEEITAGKRARAAATYAAVSGSTGVLSNVLAQKLPENAKILKYLLSGQQGKKIKTFDKKSLIGSLAFGAMYGLVSPDVKNAIARAKMDSSLKQEAIKAIRERGRMAGKVLPKAYFEKQSAILPMLGKLVAGAGRTAAHSAKVLGYGMLPMGSRGKFGRTGMRLAGRKTPFPLSHKVFGAATKLTAGTGLFLGGRSIYRKIKDRDYPRDYTAHLRNNLLAGNISPDELNPEEMEAVRTRGMK